MLTVNILFNAVTRLMEVTSISTQGKVIGTTGDSEETRLQFSWEDPEGILSSYSKRVDFGVELINEEGQVYKPYLALDSDDGVVLTSAIMSSVKCGKLPIQLVLKKTVRGVDYNYDSLNILSLAVNTALDAIRDSEYERDVRFGEVVYNVKYNPTLATFTFIRVDGTEISIALTDLAEDHFEVNSYEQLTTLSKAETGDSATDLSTGIWYKLYGTYSNLEDWKQIPGGAVLNGSSTARPIFYAPTTYGKNNEVLVGKGKNKSPIWLRTTANVKLMFAYNDENVGLSSLLDLDPNTGIECSFLDSEGNSVILPYKINYSNNVPQSVTVSSKLNEQINMTVKSVPYAVKG